MKTRYQKPSVVVLATASAAIQNTGNKGSFTHTDQRNPTFEPSTGMAYDLDEQD